MLNEIEKDFNRGIRENESGVSCLSDEQVLWLVNKVKSLQEQLDVKDAKIAELSSERQSLDKKLTGYIGNLVKQKEHYRDSIKPHIIAG